MRALAMALFLVLPTVAGAQHFTDPEMVRKILGMTRANWVAVREFDGRDLVYFTHLMAYRCGLTELRYGINSDAADTVFEMEPCYTDEATPNAIKGLPYISLPLGSVERVVVEITYADGLAERAVFGRAGPIEP
ncbi:hypothetical protein EJA01_03570 [Rhodovulum iodosum]|nr:hypothetical protein EJA01_03570 [Rhodovulum robiginosum]